MSSKNEGGADHALLLCVAGDRQLSAQCARLLETQFQVKTIDGVEAFQHVAPDSCFKVLYTSYVVMAPECYSVIGMARSRWPGIRVLHLVRSSNVCRPQGQDWLLGVNEAPKLLLECVSNLLN